MRTRSVRRSAPLRMAGAAAVLGVLVAGCGSDVTAGAGPAEVSGSPTVTPSSSTPSTSPTPSPSPSLPPGDPGLEAPEAADPGTKPPAPEKPEEARRDVPVEALLDAETVGMVLGGRWQSRPGGQDECLRPAGSAGERSMSFGGAVEGIVVQTLATYADEAAADAAVKSLGTTAAECGWTAKPDPRLGTASVAAGDGPRTMTAVSAEGVVVLLVGTGDFTGDPLRWGSLADLAIGTSCPAAPHGCD